MSQLRSGIPYEREAPSDASWEDIDLDVVAAYRRRRSQIDQEAGELELADEDLLISLRCVVRRNGNVVPNIAGILLFGTKSALRRLMPMESRVDYVLVEGSEWIGDPSTRYHSIDYREPLISLLPRLHAQVMGDLPTRFHLETGQLQRTDIPSIPRDVIREALANALMHRDYRVGQPTQVIRYSNRLEFRNAGYSLKPFEEFTQPGSKPRNPIIASVFHELKYAETKGTGIRTMRKLMVAAGLTTPPIIETDRDRNEFDLVLLPHHLLDQKDLEWLLQFREYSLSDAERRVMVLVREMGAVTNLDYRQINGTDILTASRGLGHLRDLGLLTMKGAGNGTYYILNEQARVPPKESSPGGIVSEIDYATPLSKGLDALPKGFPPLPESLRQEIISIPKRCSDRRIRKIIKQLCFFGPLQLSELGRILNRDPQYLRIFFLSKMLKSGELIYEFPELAGHPQQAYKALNLDEG